MRKLLLFIALAFSCTASHEEKLHAQSVETHDLAIETGTHVSDKIGRIKAYVQKLEEPLKSLLLDSVKVLNEEYAFWESTIVEVPGHDHEHHDHNHAGHDHNHAPAPDLTPEMVLDIQKDLKDRIEKLNIRTQKLLDTIRNEERR